MYYFLFFTALVTTITTSYYWYENRTDKESVKIYKAMTIIGFISVFIFGTLLIPEDFLEVYFYHIIGLLIGIMIIDIARRLVKLLFKKSYLLAMKYLSSILLIAILFFFIFSFYKQQSSEAMQEASNRAKIAQSYAEDHFIQCLDISNEAINGRTYSFVTNDPIYYIIAFSYRVDGETDDKIYGYQVSVDDTYHCTIMKQGEEIGKQLFSVNIQEEISSIK